MMPRWHDGPLSTLRRDKRPVIWSVVADSPAATEALAGARADRADLADAGRVRDGELRLVRRRLARALIAEVAGVHPDTICLARSEVGAPLVVSPQGWYLSLSGRDMECLIGVACQPVGVDRERVEVIPPLWDTLTAAEARVLRDVPAADQPLEWLRRWTIKEAHAKLAGEPRRIAPESIETSVHDASFATADCEGISRCWTRRTSDALETVALWLASGSGAVA